MRSDSESKRIFSVLLVVILAQIAMLPAMARAQAESGIAGWIGAPHRTPRNVARDPHRHPLETLMFFGVRETSAVVEILPGSAGYYMEILAPYLKDRGFYIAANRDEAAAPQYLADLQKLLARLEAEPALYGKVIVTKFNAD